jgi:hypothetical protein
MLDRTLETRPMPPVTFADQRGESRRPSEDWMVLTLLFVHAERIRA